MFSALSRGGEHFPTAPSVTPEQDKAGVLYLAGSFGYCPFKGVYSRAELKIGDVINLKCYSVTLTYDHAHPHLKEVKEGAFFSSEGKIFF